jgi:putative Holliday junction resolvase
MRSLRVLAVDPGEKRIGLAISDLTGTIANPLQIIYHSNRVRDAITILQIAKEREAQVIVVGVALDADDRATPSSRSAERLAEAIRGQTNMEVILWDEYGTTKVVKETLLEMGIGSKRRRGHHDAIAATLLLQSYLDSHHIRPDPG